MRIFIILEPAAGGHVLAKIKVPAVGRHTRFTRILLVVFALGHLQTLAARNMVHPHFARTEGTPAGEMFAGNQVVAIRGPASVVEQTEIFFGHHLSSAAVFTHDPDVVAAAAVTGKTDQVAVRTETGLHLVSGSA